MDTITMSHALYGTAKELLNVAEKKLKENQEMAAEINIAIANALVKIGDKLHPANPTINE